MYKQAHRCIGGGISATIAVLYGFSIVTVVILTIVGWLLGSLPDLDQNLPFFKHRGFSHSPLFAVLIVVPIAFGILYLGWIVNAMVKVKSLNTSVSSVGGLFVPSAFGYVIRGDLLGFFLDALTGIFFSLFSSLISHIILDIITPSGIGLFGHRIGGGILSDDPTSNRLFVLMGSFMMVASISISIINLFSEASYWASVVMLSFVVFISIIFFASFYKKQLRVLDQVKCFNALNTTFCTRKKCVDVNGEKFCDPEK